MRILANFTIAELTRTNHHKTHSQTIKTFFKDTKKVVVLSIASKTPLTTALLLICSVTAVSLCTQLFTCSYQPRSKQISRTLTSFIAKKHRPQMNNSMNHSTLTASLLLSAKSGTLQLLWRKCK